MRKSSERALDVLNTCAADMRDGVGPYLTLLLVSKTEWTPSKIGWALAAANTASLFCATPAGFIFDSSKNKRWWLIGPSLAIALFTFCIMIADQFWPIIGLQIGTGIACAFIGPGIATLSLALAGPKDLGMRIGRNETFNHAGNFCAALLVAYLIGQYSVMSAFYLVIIMSIISAFSVLFIPRIESRPRTQRPQIYFEKKIILLLVTALLFQFANASLLPIAVQNISLVSKSEGARFLSYGIVVSQVVAIVFAWLTGWAAQKIAIRWCLIIGIHAVVLRALCFAFVTNVNVLIFIQVFDGVAAGVLAVAPILAISKISNQSFAFSAGLLATAIGLGASISNVAAGYLFENWGMHFYFLFMASMGVLALAVTLLSQSTYTK